MIDRQPLTAGRHGEWRIIPPPSAPPRPQSLGPDRASGPPLIAIAASTGGPTALTTVLRGLRGTKSAVLVVQHIGADLSRNLADWLGRVTGLEVALAAHGDHLRPGRVLLAPGGEHLAVDGRGRAALRRANGELHQPSADILFMSLAANAPRRTTAAILTGMGSDGANGLLALRQAGAMTFAQDGPTSAVYGMAKAAVELGAVRRVLPLDAIGPALARATRTPRPRGLL